ncbi:MAG: lipopolysaccharide biosynthesis protein [Dermatophilus congolensis]|nr:lipopolysaccharide biosynthesis protein [Dermatophilus congolensis]
MAGLASRAARGAGITLISQGLRLVVQLGSLLVLSRLLTPAEVGLFAMVMSVVSVADIVRDFGLSSGAIQAPDLSAGERNNLFWANVGLGTLCGLAAAASAPLLALIYGDPEVVSVTLVLAGTFLISGATTQYRADLMRKLKFTSLALIDVGAQFVAATGAIIAALAGMGLWAQVVQQWLSVVVALIATMVIGRWLPGRYRRDVNIRKFFTFGWPILGTNVLGWAINNVDNIGIGAVLGPNAVGLYSRAYRLMLVPLGLTNVPFQSVALPVLSKVQNERVTFDHYVRRMHLVSCYVLSLGFGVMGGLAVPLVAILLGSQWTAAAPIFAVLAAGGVFKALTVMFYQVYVSLGQTGQLFRMYLITRPVMLVLILGGLPWGPLGVAFGHLIAAIWFWWYSLRKISTMTSVPVAGVTAESSRAVFLVSLPAALAAFGGTLLVDNVVLQVLVGGLAALLWTALVGLLIPSVRRDFVIVIRSAMMALPTKVAAKLTPKSRYQGSHRA